MMPGLNEREILRETLEITEKGQYLCGGKTVYLAEDRAAHREAIVWGEEEVKALCENHSLSLEPYCGQMVCSVVNQDSYDAVVEMMDSSLWRSQRHPGRVMVLNFANPVSPGGGVRCGARAQEEDLCRRSTLLVSLESSAAKKFYDCHKGLHHTLASDCMILSPCVEIFRRRDGEMMEAPVTAAVLTAAAPAVGYLSERPDDQSLEEIFYRRILGMLHVACECGFEYLVLGAWGCGAFGNDAGLVAGQFKRALTDFRYTIAQDDGRALQEGKDQCFRHVEFAVLDHSMAQYNYRCFLSAFPEERYGKTRKMAEQDAEYVMEIRAGKKRYEDAVRGCMVGGGVGDALGYPVEFQSERGIRGTYGKEGITSYHFSTEEGPAVISDDTQMSMFTATGILAGYTRGQMRGIMGPLYDYVYEHYKDWLYTQQSTGESPGRSWLREIKGLQVRRAPGGTCLSSLESGRCGTRESPVNRSKGCGGVMRVAPVALIFRNYSGSEEGFPLNMMKEIDLEGADVAAITHGHPLGFIPAAALVHIVNRVVYGGCTCGNTLYDITAECRQVMIALFRDEPHLSCFLKKLDDAVDFSRNRETDSDNIRVLGEGWVAEEAFAIALYCSLKYSDDFTKAVTAAVNHGGDSDSTGAIAGNIVGAAVGYEKIEEKWKERLEFRELLIELADDLCYGCEMDGYSSYEDRGWMEKYMAGRMPEDRKKRRESKG